jgi:N-acylglucosamine-6-phosphate 2-epimerase
MRHPFVTARVAQSAVRGGAVAVRIQGIEDLRATRAVVDVPVIGLWKDGSHGVVITPTLKHAIAVARSGAHIVAMDGTRRPRPDGLDLAQTIRGLREAVDTIVMADCGSVADAVAAQEAGADLIGTTLAGYTSDRARTPGVDLDVIASIVKACRLPVVAEGRVATPEDAAAALAAGAYAVCVGTAITHPISITKSFVDALSSD